MPNVRARLIPEHRAAFLLREYDADELPVDVAELAAKLDARVIYQHFPDETSGILIRDSARTLISVNKTHHKHRQRFTIAHELGHLILHPGRPVLIESDLRFNLRTNAPGVASSLEEAEANQFAAALLMPAERVRFELETKISRSHDMIDDAVVKRLAKTFDVSARAMEIRLSILGLVSILK